MRPLPNAGVCLLILMGCGSPSAEGGTSAEPAAAAAPEGESAAESPTEEPQPAEEEEAPGEQAPELTVPAAFVGRWVQSEDPTGELALDPVYAGSTLELDAEGGYAFGLGGGGSMGPMRGQLRRTGGEGDELRYVVTYASGAETDEQILRLRRAEGEVVGLEAGAEGAGFRYYTRTAADE